MSINLPTKFKLLFLSPKYNFIYINNKEFSNDRPFDLLISECSKKEKENLIAIKEKNSVYFYYLYKKKINEKILEPFDLQYEFNNKKNFEINFHDYFYLALLLEKDVINYIYDKKIIDDFDTIENKGEFSDLIKSKIIQILIDYFIEIEDHTDIEKNLNQIKQNYLDNLDSYEVKNKLNNYSLDYTSKNIKKFELEVIYINIVMNVLLKSEFMENNENNIEKIIKEIDLKNINLTESMLKAIVKFFESDEKNKYIISEENKEIIINSYYYLCKYILKKDYYIIYQSEFLLKLNEEIKDIIIKENQKLLESKKINKEKLQYFQDLFIINDKVINKEETENLIYSKKNYSKPNEINALKTKEKSSDKLNDKDKKHETNFSPQIDTSFQNKNQIEYIKQLDDSADSSFTDENCDLLIFKALIMFDKFNNIYKTKQILELGNKYFVKLDTNNNIFIYSRNNVYEKLCFKKNGNIHGLAKSNNEYFFVAIYLNEFIYLTYSEEDKKIIENSRIKNEKKLFQFFEISNENDIIEYITLGDAGLFITKDKNPIKEESKLKLIGGIKITNNLYAFYSNKYFFEENIIILYNLSKKNPIYELYDDNNQNCSYPSDNNELHLIHIDDNFKILLCACKSYKSGDINGILIVILDINKSNFKIQELINTEDFEINCFCTIIENKEKHFEYFLTGGLEKNKRRRTVKLYKIIYNNIFNEDIKVEIEYVQDAIEQFDKINFDGKIYKIIKTNDNENNTNNTNIIIHCKNGSIYLFKLNNDNIFFH